MSRRKPHQASKVSSFENHEEECVTDLTVSLALNLDFHRWIPVGEARGLLRRRINYFN